MRKIAVTGGIASGKSTVCRLLKELGAYVISADDVVHQLLIPQTDLGQRVVALLGEDVVVDESFSREVIANKVFNDYHLLKNLERLLHPEVQRFIEAQYYRILQDKFPYSLFVVEVPLLFESGQDVFYDATLTVLSDKEKCKERFITHSHYDAEEFNRRSNRLLSDKQREQKASFTIHNNGTLEDLKHAVTLLYIQLIN